MSTLPAINPDSGTPLHRQVYEALRAAILDGQLLPGERLMASRVLAAQLALSRETVADAYAQLQAEGYVQARRGSGTYVAPVPPAGPAQTAPVRPMALSAWGQRLAPPTPEQHVTWDLRPGSVSAEHFPWKAWRDATNRAMKNARQALRSYPPPAGYPPLLACIAEHIRAYRSARCTPDQIVIVNGAQQGLNLLSQVLLERGDRVAVEDPGYPAARLALEARGVDITYVPVDAEGLDVTALEHAGTQRLIHVTPSHQHPTGATLSLARRIALLETAARYGGFIFEDDYDSEFRYEGRPVESLQGLDRHSQVVYAGTFSKALLPGLRLGFLVLPPQLVGPVTAAKALWDGGTPLLEQAVLAEFMQSGAFERHIRRMRRVYRQRRDALVTALRDVFGSQVSIGQCHSGLTVLVSFDVSQSEEELARRAAEIGIGIRPASPFYAHPPQFPTFLVAFGALPAEDIRAAVADLATVFG